jgi:sugar lactone lactonase YvrE
VATLAGAIVPGFADGSIADARFNQPANVAVDANGNVFVADAGNHAIRRITRAGMVSTLAGSGIAGSADGTGAAASFDTPSGLAIDATGNVYVADRGNHRIRVITPAGVVGTLAGSGVAGATDGEGSAATFNLPTDIDLDLAGNAYVADSGNNKIRLVAADGTVSTLAGSVAGGENGRAETATFRDPAGITLGANGSLYVADDSYNVPREVIP